MIKQICTDLETSKRLKELGFDDSKSEFVYWNNEPCYYHSLPFYEIDRINDLITCYTLEQIIDELPVNINYGDYRFYLRFEKCQGVFWYEGGYNQTRKLEIATINNDNLATTAAKLWIKLKESEII